GPRGSGPGAAVPRRPRHLPARDASDHGEAGRRILALGWAYSLITPAAGANNAVMALVARAQSLSPRSPTARLIRHRPPAGYRPHVPARGLRPRNRRRSTMFDDAVPTAI